ncbi:uncharacterized protein [Venturia canescens]|nr:uncharacterized protein LOC122414762 isoform X2 [Venturia canescens]
MCTAVGARKRQAKATSSQIDFMVDYFIQNPHVATGKFQSLHGKFDLSASWEKLAEELNQMWNDGRTKDVKSWKSTWRDNKTLVSQKVAKIRANQAATGNVTGPPVKLTERDQKILGLMGHDYVEGVESPDAFPEEQANAIELLAEGDEDILEIGANSLTVRSNSDISDSTHYTNYDQLDDLLEGTDETELFLIKNKSVKKQKTALTATDAQAAALSEPCQSSSPQKPSYALSASDKNSSRQKTPSRPGRVTNAIKRCPNRLGIQLQDARDDFVDLAERQILCMEMFAKTMQQIADNDKERNEIFRTLVESQKTRDEAFSQLTVVIKDCVDALKRN